MEQYNTQKAHITLREYGRNVQMIAKHVQSTDNREERTKLAYTLVELMKQVNPSIKDNQDYNQKIWDDLFIICGFDLDVETPYPRPDKSILAKKPDIVGYNTNNLRYRHYGRNVELLIKKAIETDDQDEKEAITLFVGKLMKRFFFTWNKDIPEDEIVIKNIYELSGGKLTLDVEKVKAEKLLETSYKDNDSQGSNQSNNHHRGGGHHNNNRGKRKGGGGHRGGHGGHRGGRR